MKKKRAAKVDVTEKPLWLTPRDAYFLKGLCKLALREAQDAPSLEILRGIIKRMPRTAKEPR